jgi:hypothetical protein
MSKSKKRTPADGEDAASADQTNTLSIYMQKGETSGQASARYAIRPTVNAAITMKHICRDRASVPLNDLIDALGKQCDAVNANDLKRAEGMLITQAHTLDALFNQLVMRATLNQGEYLDAADRYYKLALRAQNQARATLETLATIKNPPNLAIVKQANIGQTVQVNNGPAPTSRAQENENAPNKLLEVNDGKRLDVGATAPTSRADSALEAVEAIDRTKDTAR